MSQNQMRFANRSQPTQVSSDETAAQYSAKFPEARVGGRTNLDVTTVARFSVNGKPLLEVLGKEVGFALFKSRSSSPSG